ncbi:hypothetical protein CIPAW_02G022800 [Carya illinoinensis]|uniref:Uncharacterized protein n=1 Tax=Carya illinoinensis TaxID=32201 RepID=A0A8T1R8C9_CARIL|nr:hypothetical protein CIPAW_02G022800 [Carya illinoinensis]
MLYWVVNLANEETDKNTKNSVQLSRLQNIIQKTQTINLFLSLSFLGNQAEKQYIPDKKRNCMKEKASDRERERGGKNRGKLTAIALPTELGTEKQDFSRDSTAKIKPTAVIQTTKLTQREKYRES